MPMSAFSSRFPEVGPEETRSIQVLSDEHIPPGEYAFFEMYCDEPDCDCRRVFILVIARDMPKKPLATINYGWENKEFYAKWMHWKQDEECIDAMKGPSLAPMAHQSEFAPHLLGLFREIVESTAYVARLKRHYAMFRETVEAGCGARQGSGAPRTEQRTVRPNAPCPCRSGKKFKKCCGAGGVAARGSLAARGWWGRPHPTQLSQICALPTPAPRIRGAG